MKLKVKKSTELSKKPEVCTEDDNTRAIAVLDGEIKDLDARILELKAKRKAKALEMFLLEVAPYKEDDIVTVQLGKEPVKGSLELVYEYDSDYTYYLRPIKKDGSISAQHRYIGYHKDIPKLIKEFAEK